MKIFRCFAALQLIEDPVITMKINILLSDPKNILTNAYISVSSNPEEIFVRAQIDTSSEPEDVSFIAKRDIPLNPQNIIINIQVDISSDTEDTRNNTSTDKKNRQITLKVNSLDSEELLVTVRVNEPSDKKLEFS